MEEQRGAPVAAQSTEVHVLQVRRADRELERRSAVVHLYRKGVQLQRHDDPAQRPRPTMQYYTTSISVRRALLESCSPYRPHALPQLLPGEGGMGGWVRHDLEGYGALVGVAFHICGRNYSVV